MVAGSTATALQSLDCFHCGEPVPGNSEFTALIDGEQRPMCCPGCQAVANLIAGSGMSVFYQQRTAFNERPSGSEQDDTFAIYNDTSMAQTFCSIGDDGTTRAQLLLGGITCAACTWLIESTLMRIEGVSFASVNLHQSRLDVRFSTEKIRPSELFEAIAALGYTPRPFHSNARREQLQQEYKKDLRRLAVAGIGMMQVGMFAIALHAGSIQGIALQYQSLLRWVSLLVASFVVLFSAKPFFITAWRHLKQRTLVMDMPVALAIGIAWLASVWATVRNTGDVYFDSIVMFTFFLLLARFIERRIRERSLQSWIDTEAGLPDAVEVKRGDQWHTLPRKQLVGGEQVLVLPGRVIPIDATVFSGSSAVREDAFNGEYFPRTVNAGDSVFAGTVNTEGLLELTAAGSYLQTRLNALQRSLDSSKHKKPRLAQLADRVASWFVAAILVITVVTAITWLQIDPSRALWVSLSVLVISCPCALALATPAALASSANALRKLGVIVHGDNALATLASCNRAVFDKTGTLTRGRLSLARIVTSPDTTQDEANSIAQALQQYSNHPIAAAFTQTQQLPTLKAVEVVSGAGIEGSDGTLRYRVGSERFCREIAPELEAMPEGEFHWIALCATDRPMAWFGLQDEEREEAGPLIRQLHRAGMQVEMATGDSSGQAKQLASQLAFNDVHTGMNPQDKLSLVQKRQSQGDVVVMVGDGLNDAPVLGVANASFAVATATDLARSQADFIVNEDDLALVGTTLTHARKCRRVIRQNLVWALGYNLCALPLAATGSVPPWAAALGMSFSSLLVVLNSLRLQRQGAA
ncbi:MAG: heavy metal translocating P-type ATPase [Halioglobus sp.]